MFRRLINHSNNIFTKLIYNPKTKYFIGGFIVIGSYYNFCNEREKRYNNYKNIVETNYYLINQIPDKCLSEEMFSIALKKGAKIYEIPSIHNYWTNKLIIESLDNNTLVDIPQDKLTEEICKIAVKKNNTNILFVPKKYMTEKFIIDSIKNGVRTYQLSGEYLTTNIINELLLYETNEMIINHLHTLLHNKNKKKIE